MPSYTITLDLPEDVYKRAKHVAQTTERSLEQVIASWIAPPLSSPDELIDEVAELEKLEDDELIQIARSGMPEDEVVCLHEMLTLQRESGLSETEWREAASLVEKEDWYTLRKARALYLLQERGVLPDDLGELLDEMRHGLHSPQR